MTQPMITTSTFSNRARSVYKIRWVASSRPSAFQATPNIADLEAAITRFVATDGILDRTAPAAFLAGEERAAVWKDGKFRISLYKALLFRHVAGAIKSGSLNLEQSHKRRPLESYLIDRNRWLTEREQLLDRAGMTGFKDPAPVLEELDAALQTRFEDTNRAIAEGLNPHFKMLTGKAFRVSTPKQDEEESEPLRHFFPERHYVPLTEILATVNLHTGFATELRHLRQTHVRAVSEKILFAGVIGLGCAIGSAKMAQISTSLSVARTRQRHQLALLPGKSLGGQRPDHEFHGRHGVAQHLSPIGE